MAKFNFRGLSLKDRQAISNEVVAIVRAATSDKDMHKLLSNLLTPSEMVMIGRRIMIAERLIQEKTYAEIRRELKVGLSTIVGVQKWLEEGRVDSNVGKMKVKQKRHSSHTPYIVGSPEHGVSIIAARMGLLGFLLSGLNSLATAAARERRRNKLT